MPIDRTLEEWRDYLLPQLETRRYQIRKLRRYYDGDHPFPTAPSRTTDKYRRLAELGVTNMCGLVVDAPTAMLAPQEVRTAGDGAPDGVELWERVWKSNRMNAECRIAHEEALKVGRSFVLVWPNDDTGGVDVTVEDAAEVIVSYEPGSKTRRAAALKHYCDEDIDIVQVWTPEEVATWRRSAKRRGRPAGEWSEGPDEEQGPNPLGAVPVVEFLCKPDGRGTPSPELSTAVLRLQDRLNKTMFDTVVAAEDGAHPQRYSIDIEIPKTQTEVDGETKTVAKNPLPVGPNRVWALNSRGTATGSVGQLEAFDNQSLLRLAGETVRQLGWISRTSSIYMLGGASNVGADMIRALDAGHKAKVLAHMAVFGECYEDVFSLAIRALGLAEPESIEIGWASVEFRSPAEMADAALKLRQAGYSFPAIARYMGASETEVRRLVAEREEEIAAGQNAEPTVDVPA